jgi:hypothetical protein
MIHRVNMMIEDGRYQHGAVLRKCPASVGLEAGNRASAFL